MNRSFHLFGPLKIWHFLLPGLLCYGVPLGFYLKDFRNTGKAGAVVLAILATILLVRHGCRKAPRPLEYGNRFACLILAGAAGSLILLSGMKSNASLAYTSFVIAGLACAGWLGSWALVRSLSPVWVLSLLFLPGVSNWLQSVSLEIWSLILPAVSRVLDFCLVPNDITGKSVGLTGGKSVGVVGSAVKGIALNALVISTVVSFLQNRPLFFTFFASLASLLILPLFAVCAVVLQGALIFYFHTASSSWFAPLVAAVLIFVMNLALQFFGSDQSEWIWKEEAPTLDEAGSVFEGCDFGPLMLLVLLLVAFSGLAASALFLSRRFNFAIF